MGTTERVWTLVAPVLEGKGYQLYDVEHTGATLRVLVDRPGGVDIEALSAASHVVSDLLDRADPDPMPGPYTLEVSSPGLERRLRTPAHFRAALGRQVSVKTRPAADVGGGRRVEGTLAAATDDAITVQVGSDDVEVPYDCIDRAKTVFAWGQGEKPVRSGRESPGS